MSEERIKEPKPCPFCGEKAEKYNDNTYGCGNPDCPESGAFPVELWNHRIVAAEARKEGRKEGIDEMERATFEPFKAVEYISRMALWDCLKSTAKQLKEKV